MCEGEKKRLGNPGALANLDLSESAACQLAAVHAVQDSFLLLAHHDGGSTIWWMLFKVSLAALKEFEH